MGVIGKRVLFAFWRWAGLAFDATTRAGDSMTLASWFLPIRSTVDVRNVLCAGVIERPMRLGIQLYTLRNVEESLIDTIDRVGSTIFEGVEFAGLGDTDPEAVAGTLEEADLDVAAAHVGVDDLSGDVKDILTTYEILGCRDLVVPSYDREAFETRETAQEAGRTLATLADRLGDEARLHYHNHTFEFPPLSTGTAFDAFATAATGVGLEIDTGLANHAGVDPVSLIDRYGDRIRLVHLTDSRPGSMDTRHMDLGTGDVDLAGCVAASADADVDWLIFEHGLTDDPINSMEAAADTLEELT